MYPEIEPFFTEMLAVSPIHSLYVERSGTRGGCPIFFVHGGPGSSTNSHYRRYFDPQFFDIVLFDQRGCGKSIPLGETADNNTSALVKDIHAIKEALNITRKINLLGGSWGSTLALAYTLAYPDYVQELILRGVFLGSQAEVDWFTDGLSRFALPAWEDFSCHEPGDLVSRYYQQVNYEDEDLAYLAAQRWVQYEGQIMSLGTTKSAPKSIDMGLSKSKMLARVRVQLHFLQHQCFLAHDELINRAPTIDSPVTIVQGDMDMVCPPLMAYRLSQRLPHTKLRIINGAGHGGLSTPLAEALTQEADNLRDRIRGKDESSI